MNKPDDELIRYLLDQMDEEERSGFEDRLIQQPSLFEQVAAAEDDLIMRHVRGDLNASLARRFAEIYLTSPAKRARVAAAQVWCQAVRDTATVRDTARVTRTATLGFSLRRSWVAIVATIIVGVGVWSWWTLAAKKHAPSSPQSAPVSFLLEPGLVRSGGGAQFAIPAGIDNVQLRLALQDTDSKRTYRVIVARPERPSLWSGKGVSQDGTVVTTIPAAILTPGDYGVHLQLLSKDSNWDEIASYFFRIVR